MKSEETKKEKKYINRFCADHQVVMMRTRSNPPLIPPEKSLATQPMTLLCLQHGKRSLIRPLSP